MKKIIIFVVIAAIGGGAYMFFQEREKFDELLETAKDQVDTIITGSDWQKLEKYGKDFSKKGLEEGEEKDGYMANFKEEFTIAEYRDASDGVLKLAHDGSVPQAMLISYSETSEGEMVTVSKEQWKHFFGEEVEFLEDGSAEAEHAEGSWKTVDGMIEIVINRAELEKLPAVKEMPKEVQTAISEFRGLIKEKVDMTAKYDKLDDEKQFCLDKTRFKEIVSEIDSLKKRAEEVTKKAKELMAKIPQAQIALIRKELDGASLE